jgi:hypothetical protein
MPPQLQNKSKKIYLKDKTFSDRLDWELAEELHYSLRISTLFGYSLLECVKEYKRKQRIPAFCCDSLAGNSRQPSQVSFAGGRVSDYSFKCSQMSAWLSKTPATAAKTPETGFVLTFSLLLSNRCCDF